MKTFKKVFIIGLILIAISALFILWANHEIKSQSQPYIYSEVEKVPVDKVGLLLGTSKTLKSGYKNLYFHYRIDAAAELYHAGKITHFIVSGDNSRKDYNEPEDMKIALIEKGIPENRIYEDFAGFRTLDSVVRAKEIFGQKSFIIISQKFHNERAVYLARKNGIKAFAYNAKDVAKYSGLKTRIREYFARVKVFIDFMTQKSPKYRGKRIEIK